MKQMVICLMALVIGVSIIACGGQPASTPEQPVELTVSAAASLTDVMGAIRTEFNKHYPQISLVFNMGPSGQLQQQIEQGAPVDVFISAAQRQMNGLQDKELIIEETRVDILRNELVLIVGLDNNYVNSFADLTKEEVKYIGIGSPESVPAGQYAKGVLEEIELWEVLAPKLVEGQNVRTVLNYVETGNAEAGFVYSSDTLIADKVKIVATAPQGSAEAILYPAAVLKDSRNQEAARAFVEFLKTEEAITVLEGFGFKRVESRD